MRVQMWYAWFLTPLCICIEPPHYGMKNFKIPRNVFNKKCLKYIFSEECQPVLKDIENTEKQRGLACI